VRARCDERELGVSGPALYRYFKNRDALLTALIEDAYDDLADALARRYRAWPLPSRTATGCSLRRRCPATTPTSRS
jgi:AcrR family transcriptional regulator